MRSTLFWGEPFCAWPLFTVWRRIPPKLNRNTISWILRMIECRWYRFTTDRMKSLCCTIIPAEWW